MKRPLLAIAAFGFCAFACAQAGVWKGSADEDTISTYVESDDGHLLSYLCTKDGEGCAWGLSVDIRCNKDAEQPILGSSTGGSAHLTLVCVGPSARTPLYAFYIKEYEQVLNLVESGGVVGFVIPLASGKFSVHRFNADGAIAAAKRVADAVTKAKPTKMKAETL